MGWPLGPKRPLSLYRRSGTAQLLSAMTVAAIGRWVYNVALPAYVYEVTHSPAWVAGVVLGRYLPALILSPIAAALLAHRPQRSVLLGCDTFAAAASASMAVLMSIRGPIGAIVAVAAAASFATRVKMPVAVSYGATLVDEDDLIAMNGALRSTESLAMAIGPAIGAALVGLAPAWVAVALTAATFTVSAVVTATLPRLRSPIELAVRSGRAVAESWRVVMGAPAGRTFALLAFQVGALLGADTVILAVVSHNRLHAGQAGYGLLFAGLGVGGFVGVTVVDRLSRTLRPGTLIVGALVCYAAPTLTLLAVRQTAVAVGVEIVRGAAGAVAETLALTALQRTTKARLNHAVFVFHNLVLAGLVGGAAIAPVLLRQFGLSWTLVLAGLVVPCVALSFLPSVVALDRRGLAETTALAAHVSVLRRLDVFSGAPRTMLERLALGVEEVGARDGDQIIVEGTPADYFYVLVRGDVDVVSTGDSTELPVWLRTMQAPAHFGEIGLMRRIPRTATVIARGAVELYRIDGDDFLAAVADASDIGTTVSREASSRLETSHGPRDVSRMS